jgi:hypothetical protein|nr:MAG TPA: hypothetical protein [Caudoviricetes sp.]
MSKPVTINIGGIPIEYHVTNLGYVVYLRFSLDSNGLTTKNKLHRVTKKLLAPDMLEKLHRLRKNKHKLAIYLGTLVYFQNYYNPK